MKMNYKKYKRGYYMPPTPTMSWVEKEYIGRAPIWCSVDLRDGNQALVIPMSLDDKLEFFKLLVKIGFKEIEVGFPAASETEYEFLRTLIERDLIPDDVTVQVLTQARPHIIKKTFDALAGCKSAIVHLYNSTSVAQREQVFKKSKDEIKALAIEGAAYIKQLAAETPGCFRFEYSPESFTGTEPEYALEVCNAVLDIWQPTAEQKTIINLPATVEMSLPHVYAGQIEYMSRNLKHRENVIISLHPHNDRGCGIADSELGLLAGGDRIEGTLFGNGERTGNVDLVTLAMNLYSHGVDPELDFSNMPRICDIYERVTNMSIPERQPYCGKLVFAAFSGSHQDAIAKGMKCREQTGDPHWTVPYLPIDPQDVGREYETDVIRINSQSGKGGVSYLLEQYNGLILPKRLGEEFGYVIKEISDHAHQEIKPEAVYEIFLETYTRQLNIINMVDHRFTRNDDDTFTVDLRLKYRGFEQELVCDGNGRLDAVSNALKKALNIDYNLATYSEHALEKGSTSRAVSYVGIERLDDDTLVWGAGIHDDIITASVRALFNAVNRMLNNAK